jgi:hypothetical protein
LQSAGRRQAGRVCEIRPAAECNSAIRQIANLRYLEARRAENICAGKQNFMDSNMKSNATKSPNRKAALQTAGRRWNPTKRSLLRAGLLAALCALTGSSALASFSDFQEYPWQGGVNNFYGNTLITSAGTFNNSGALIYDTSTLPGNTGPLFGWDLTPGVTRSGNYYLGVGVLDYGRGPDPNRRHRQGQDGFVCE